MTRLDGILRAIKPCECLADIGADHAKLAISAVRAGVVKKAIACDIAPGPLAAARKNIADSGLDSKIETRLGDGLDCLTIAEANCIVIAGMGGMNIVEILESGREKWRDSRLVLQPQHNIPEVRRALHRMGCVIEDELAVYESPRWYVIISAEISCNEIEKMWDESLYFTGIQGSTPRDTWRRYLQHCAEKTERYLPNITSASARRIAEQQILWLKDLLPNQEVSK